MILARVLAQPSSVHALNADGWSGLLCVAHAERLLPTLAHRVAALEIPESVEAILDNARMHADAGRVRALWEIEMARRALGPLGVPVVLLKGSAFIAAGLEAGKGRLVGDLDILVPRDRLDEVEAAIIGAGWESLKADAYDDQYYRRWMHELPPLIHRERDAMIDVHHTILPLTARPMPDAALLIADSAPLENGLLLLCPEDMVIHAAAHLFADGDLSGGLRNLWDIRCLLEEFPMTGLCQRAALHGLQAQTERALRLVDIVFAGSKRSGLIDRLYLARLTARDGWGRETRKLLRFAFYIRSHLIRMPLLMLVGHLFVKWRKARSSA